MDKHAQAVLSGAESWNWPALPGFRDSDNEERVKNGETFKDASRNLLAGFIAESELLGGTLSKRFWCTMGQCHPRLMDNIKELENMNSSLEQFELEALLYDGVNQDEIDFTPVFELAAELFTHLGIAFMYTNDFKRAACKFRGRGAQEEEKRKHLELSVLKRDGTSCLVTKVPFFGCEGYRPALTHVLPESAREKDTLKIITAIAGPEARSAIIQHVRGISNTVNMEAGAAAAYHRGEWGIEASVDKAGKVKYLFRSIPDDDLGYSLTPLRDGDAILFGGCPGSPSPLPFFCNLHLAIARVLNATGAAEVISQLISDADDIESPHTSNDEDFGDVLSAKLIISGRAVIT